MSQAERLSLLPELCPDEEGQASAASKAVDGAEGSSARVLPSRGKWGMARVAGIAVTATVAIASVIVLMNTSRWQYAHGTITPTMHESGVALEVEPVGHVIWLGSKLPNVKRVFLHRNQELLHQAGWKLKLWRSEDITRQNFPYTFSTIRRALRYHDDSGENVFSMIGDLMKFEILYHFGGLYMDTNIELLRDPTELFTVAASLNKEVFLVADPGGDKRFASAGFMGALKKHSPLFASLITNEQYLNEIPFEQHCVANAWTGPMFLTLKVLHFDSAIILDRDTAYPLLCGQDQKDRCLERVGNDATVGSKVDPDKSVLVKEENGDVWRIKVPCSEIADDYPEATAVDHFSLGKSWINCAAEVKSQKLVDWTLRYVHDPASFIFDFVLDQVRWSQADKMNTEKMTKRLVRRRQQLLGVTHQHAHLILLATTARSGSTLMSELLRQAFNADEDTVVWEDDSGLHSDIPLYNRFFDLGDVWSEDTLKQDWVVDDLKPKLLSMGVREKAFDNLIKHPSDFMDEVLQRTASAGFQYVLVKVGWNNDPGGADTSQRVARTLLDDYPTASIVFLERANILAQYASLTAAQETGEWMRFSNSLNPAEVPKVQPPARVKFDFGLFKVMFEARHQWLEFFHKEMLARHRKYLHLVYEEHLSTPEKQSETMKHLKDFFGFDINVNPTFLTSSVRLLKNLEVPLRERFVNPEKIPKLLTNAFPLEEKS